MAVRIAPQVEAELDGIWDYLSEESGKEEIADRLIESIVDRFFMLSKHPYLGRRRDYDLRPGLRSLPVGNYVIIYRIEGRDAVILYVLHGRRDIRGLIHE